MKTKRDFSTISLLLANVSPVFGVLFLGWNLSNIMFLYWFENVVIGFYNVLKMAKAKKSNTKGINVILNKNSIIYRSSLSTILFFIFHYGMFTFVHGILVFSLFVKNFSVDPALLIGILSLFVSHGVSYFSKYIGKKEFENTSPESLMGAPYVRVLIMHFTVIFGGSMFISFNGQPVGGLIVLIFLKSIVDFFSHNLEHNKLVPSYGGYGELNNPVPSRVVYGKPINRNSWFNKMLLPGFEKAVASIYKVSVETGKWEEIRSQLDPETAKYVEDYWFTNYGIGKGKENISLINETQPQ